jgi:hypothetical protein
MQSVRHYKKLNLAGLNACADAIGKVQRVCAAISFRRATMIAGTENRQTLIV